LFRSDICPCRGGSRARNEADLTMLVSRRGRYQPGGGYPMRKISIALVTGAGILFANSAMAADVFTNDATYLGMNQPNVEQVRLVCDDSGRCYRSRGSRPGAV